MNATVSLLKQKVSSSEALSWLIAHYGISRRQAYRYLQQAQSARGPVPVPEAKQVFTVKISVSLIGRVRQQARRQRTTIGQWVEGALRQALGLPPGHG